MSGFSRTVGKANFTRQVRNVRTSDVVSTSAPQTTCRLLIQTARWLRTVSAPSVTCTTPSATISAAGRVSSRRRRWWRHTWPAVATIASETMSAPTRWAKWMAIFGSQ